MSREQWPTNEFHSMKTVFACFTRWILRVFFFQIFSRKKTTLIKRFSKGVLCCKLHKNTYFLLWHWKWKSEGLKITPCFSLKLIPSELQQIGNCQNHPKKEEAVQPKTRTLTMTGLFIFVATHKNNNKNAKQFSSANPYQHNNQTSDA